MTHSYSTTARPKGKHFTPTERGSIAAWLEEKLSKREIARRIGVSHQAINNEIQRGTIQQVRKINGKKQSYTIYDPIFAQQRYEQERNKCHRPSKFEQVKAFLAYFIQKFKELDHLPDAVVGDAKRKEIFLPEEMVCTTTLYKYIC